MKSLILLFTCLSIGQYFALDTRKELPNYKIVSDVKDEQVLDGTCAISGQVRFNGKPIQGVVIHSFNATETITTNKDGNFYLIVDTSETALYTSHKDFVPNYFENYQFKSGHLIEMVFNLKKPKVYSPSYPHAVKKPVIYAYGEAGTTFDLSLETNANITFTYPKLEDLWTITISENGMLEDNNQQQYPYLFWEGEMTDLNFQIENNKIKGSIVEKDNTIEFLEEKLNQLGFNTKEKTDFITFWSPIIMKNDSSFIQFLIDDAYNVVSTMDFTPKPDNIRRVYLLFSDAQLIDDKFIDPPTIYSGFNRNGFTIVEWGGTEITYLKKL